MKNIWVKAALGAAMSMAMVATAAAQTPTATATPEAAPTPAPTPEAKKEDAKPEVSTGATKLKVGGVIWANYGYDLTEGNKSKNAFDVGRAYLNVEPSWGDQFYARFTPDLVRETGPALSGTAGTLTQGNTTGNLTLRVKYAYIGYKPLKDLNVRIGLQPTAYIDFEETLSGYRFLAATAADQFYGVSSSDLGLSAIYKTLGGRLEVQSGVFNGETYSKPESNKYKEVQARATFQILPAKAGGLKATGYYSIANKSQDNDKVRGIATVSYQHDAFTGAASYLYAHDGGGAAGSRVTGGGPSVFGSVKLPFLPEQGLQAMARIDMVDPDSDTDDDGTTRVIVGVGMQPHKNVRMMLDLQRLDYQDSAKEDSQVVFAHWEAKF